MTDYELAKSITDLLPLNYQQCMIYPLNTLKSVYSEEEPPLRELQWQFKKYMIIFYLVVFPNQNDLRNLMDKSYSFWKDKANEKLVELQKRQVISA
ncbi:MULTISPECIES: hypothetical protein [Enterococcus]|jgi:hypothetical protein|uniref:Uncharacterized protein n=1 Tax=Enterococcus xiangfangensis TaxID=1296537 RepID=A0ABU3F9E5_9ENTE|nr:hypothetical protein [Enterococcus xiangfangensis]MDT2759298.1 hypothetical protein [Enterococcus xiangfangensis]